MPIDSVQFATKNEQTIDFKATVVRQQYNRFSTVKIQPSNQPKPGNHNDFQLALLHLSTTTGPGLIRLLIKEN